MTSIMSRMKTNYEQPYSYILPYRMPIIIRLDGKSFHTWTRGLPKPFDQSLIDCLNTTTIALCKKLDTVQLAYLQSDEISLLLHPYKKLVSEPVYANKIQKLVSITASIFTAHFNHNWVNFFGLNSSPDLAYFDSRCFVLPEAEVCNYFIARQQDWTRNSIQLLARSLYSHKQLENKKCNELQELCFMKGINWNDLATRLKRGRCVVKQGEGWTVDNEIPEFTKDRAYVEKYLEVEPE